MSSGRTSDSIVIASAGHTAEIWSLAYSPDGKWFATGSADKTVKLWDATTGKLKADLEMDFGYDGDVCTGDDACLTGACDGTPIPEAPVVTGLGAISIDVTPQPPGSPVGRR